MTWGRTICHEEPAAPRGRRPQKKFDEKKPRKNNTRVAKGGNQERAERPERSERPERKPRQVPNPDKVTGTRLYVGNLSFDASESDLEEPYFFDDSFLGLEHFSSGLASSIESFEPPYFPSD